MIPTTPQWDWQVAAVFLALVLFVCALGWLL
jgi:hypothetical protein